MIRSMSLEVLTSENFTSRETEIINTLILNMAASLNALVIKKGVALNPVLNSKAQFSIDMVFQESIAESDSLELQNLLERRILNCFKMSKLEQPTVEIKTIVAATL